jgi:hypothetical protein
MENLEGDGALVLQITREVDGGHTSATQLAVDGVQLGESLTDELYGRHGGKVRRTLGLCQPRATEE